MDEPRGPAQQTGGLSADEYRAAFGLMKETKLVAPALRKAQAERAAKHLRQIGSPHREAIRTLSIEERRQRALKAERRAEHDRTLLHLSGRIRCSKPDSDPPLTTAEIREQCSGTREVRDGHHRSPPWAAGT